MNFALARLRLALGLALGFLLFRLFYVFVFTGASSGETLLRLPGIRLSGIFSHVVLFGSVGENGLRNALLSATPFALAIIGFGIISALISPAVIIDLAKKTRSGILAALAIGLATLPSLLDAAVRITLANRLRSEHRFRILIPLLETAIERASNVAIRFALAHRVSAPKTSTVILRNLSLDGVFADVNLVLEPGDVLVISGPTGSGKTSLLESILGIQQLRSGRSTSGSVEFFGINPEQGLADISGLVGYVPQQPRSWFIAESASRELIQPGLSWASFDNRPISQLSEGQAVKLAISNAVSQRPKLLVLDEPFAALDLESRAELNRLIQKLSAAGSIVVIAEHELGSISVPGACYFILDQTLVEGKYSPVQQFAPRKLPVVGNELLIQYTAPKIRDLVLPELLQIHQAERIALVGPNGVGKTSLLTQMAKDVPLARMVPERVEDFFVCQTVREELQRADKVAKADSGLTLLTLESLIPVSNDLLERHPRDLSAGTKLALAIAMQLAYKPQLLLVDEPVKGLDPLARERTAEVLACVAETGCAVLFATHDETFAKSADTRIELEVVPA